MSLPRSAARFILGYVGLVEGTAALIRFRDPTTGLLVEVRWQGRPWEARDRTLDPALDIRAAVIVEER